MEVKLNCGDKITIPEGCKANIENGIITIDRVSPTYQDGDIIFCKRDDADVKSEWIAIFKEQKDKHDIDLYASFYTKTTVVDELYSVEIPDYQNVECDIRLATEEEKQTLFEALEKEGYSWNAEEKKIEKHLPRAEKGCMYSFIDENTRLVHTIDSYSMMDDDLHKQGNYFLTMQEAEKYAAKIRDLFAERRKI